MNKQIGPPPEDLRPKTYTCDGCGGYQIAYWTPRGWYTIKRHDGFPQSRGIGHGFYCSAGCVLTGLSRQLPTNAAVKNALGLIALAADSLDGRS